MQVHLLGLGRHDTWTALVAMRTTGRHESVSRLTLNVGDALLEDLLQNLGALELLLDLADDGVGKVTLLALLNLAFVADPGVEHLLGLGGQSSTLLELVGLRLELGGFLGGLLATVLVQANKYKSYPDR